jgi:nucleotide-binding universal stress UspA family protein
MMGMILGSTATAIVHRAPCSVLVARAAPPTFPDAVVVGVDGSRQSLAAVEVAADLASRHGATLRVIAATGGKPVDRDRLAELDRRLEMEVSARSARPGDSGPLLLCSEKAPITALADASAGADLLVVGSRGRGSRGRHGLAVLGSVSHRLAHQARCSVLIVREPTVTRIGTDGPSFDAPTGTSNADT